MTSTQRNVTWYSILVLIAIGIFFASRHYAYRVLASSGVTVRPYTITQTGFQIAETGEEKPLLHYSISRNSEGSRYKEQIPFATHGKEDEFARYDMSDGHVAMMIHSLKIKSSGLHSDSDIAFDKQTLSSPPPNCAYTRETLDSTEVLAGHLADKISHLSDRTGTTRMLIWRMPDYNCATFQIFVQKKDDAGQWKTTAGNRLVSFAEKEPDASVFHLADDYQETNPSDFKRAVMNKKGITKEQCPTCFQEEIAQDKRYHEMNK